MDEKSLVSRSKFLSLILRHKPDEINLKLDENGYGDVNHIISNMNISFNDLEEIVSTNDKKRFEFNEDKSKIRACQGHSIDVELDLKEQIPPKTLYHGTKIDNLSSIFKSGITKQKRNFVHLSEDIKTAKKVGNRHGNSIVLHIKAKQMHNEGYKFYLSNKIMFG